MGCGGVGVWGCGVWGVGCGVWGVGCGVKGVGCGVWGVGCGVGGVGWGGSRIAKFVGGNGGGIPTSHFRENSARMPGSFR